MQSWLFSSTTYGTWLPGDARWSVTDVSGANRLTAPQPRLAQYARRQQRGAAVLLTKTHAEVVLDQFREAASYRGWRMAAAAVMANHFHLVVAVPETVDPRKVLADFKAYGSRVLNRDFRRPNGGKWWTTGGSRRPLPDERAVAAAVNYVVNKQPHALLTWRADGVRGGRGF